MCALVESTMIVQGGELATEPTRQLCSCCEASLWLSSAGKWREVAGR
ncbi:hypothetical protein OKW38_001573 [Paraburkholderia sp. MM5496-R1]